MHSNFELYFIHIIKGEINTFPARVIRILLGCVAKIYSLVVALRLFLYKHRIFRQEILGCTVISVGNITVGGTGKTPVTEMFARALEKGGRKVAVLSRGYKKKKKTFLKRIIKRKSFTHIPDVVSDGSTILLTSNTAGDEPYMLARNLPNVVVIVDKNRVKAAEYAIKQFGVDTIVMDDGFQYLPLSRQYDIVLV
ncbi:tetraacyldisaccharide 4'-kinase, partial [Chlamydiota bacterium]